MRLTRPFSLLFEQFKAYHSHGRAIVQYTGMAGMAAFPLLYLLRFAKAQPPSYDDWALRAVAVLICLGLALRNRWPERLKPYYLGYAYGALLYCIPFFFIFSSLANGGGTVGVANTLVAIFFLVLLTDWRNTLVMLFTGAAAAAGAYVLLVPNPAFPADYVARLPMALFAVIGGNLFKFAEKQAEAEKVKRTYTALAGSIAHEMRNPLSQIKLSLERMEKALPLPGTSGSAGIPDVDLLYQHLAESELAVKRGLQVIAMTLDEVGEKPLDSAGFLQLSAAEATAKAVREYGYASEEERGRVAIEVHEDFSFRGDETAFVFLLFNLIKNGLYYMVLRPDSKIVITVAHRQVRVRDNGPGMAPEVLAGLFEPFRSAGKSGGTGLGLAYCKRVMGAFGGSIRCNSVLGEYTEFVMGFPAITEQETDAHTQALLARARKAFEGKRLLIVEDDPVQRMLTSHKLAELGAAMDVAADGVRALQMLGKQAYDLVLLDLNMPVLDGYAVAARTRHGPELNRDVRIVAHTSEPAHIARVKTHRLGIDEFVSKPCPQLQLIMTLHRVLEAPVTRAMEGGAALSGRRIILADDNQANRRFVGAYLEGAGATVFEAEHGGALLQLLQRHHPVDAVVTDLNMPGTTGLEAAQIIRGSGQPWQAVPIIALTAYSDEEAMRSAHEGGMNAFLVKPVDAPLLYETLQRAIGDAPHAFAGLRPPAPANAAADSVNATPLLNLARLDSFQRLGLVDELLGDYLPEIAKHATALNRAVSEGDLKSTLDTLHALLGMSGEVGAMALHTFVRGVYGPMLEERRWPETPGWLDHIGRLVAESERELQRYCAERARSPS